MSRFRTRRNRKVFAKCQEQDELTKVNDIKCISKTPTATIGSIRSIPEYFQKLAINITKKRKEELTPLLDTSIMESYPEAIQTSETSHVEVTLYDPKMVQFADPLVTESWEIPKVRRTYKKRLFYSNRDISEFRSQSRLRFGKNFGYDIIDCEEMLEDLDLIGALNSAKGDFKGALKAFNHALRVRTQTKVNFDPVATSRNIHCIADIYSEQKNWKKALDAYSAALQALNEWQEREDEFQETVSCLNEKVELIQENLSNQSMDRKRRLPET